MYKRQTLVEISPELFDAILIIFLRLTAILMEGSLKKKASLSFKEAFRVPEAGLEPARPDGHKILSLACLPIPPLGHLLINK